MLALDVVVRVAGATLFVATALFVLRSGRAGRVTFYFLAFSLGAAGVLANNAPLPGVLMPGPVGATLSFLSGTAALWAWLFVLALFGDRFRPGPVHLAIGTAWLALAAADRGLAGPRLADAGLSRALAVLAAGMVAHLLWRLLKDREGDLIDARRDARLVLAGVVVVYLALDVAVDLVFGFAWRPLGLTLAQNAVLLAVAAWLVAMLLSADPAPLAFRGPARPLRSDPAEARLLARLDHLVREERVHLDSSLTVAAFAALMGAPEPAVRRLVNERLGHGHFRAFLNAHRVEEAKRRLADPARAGEKIASIALDSGFASLPSFGRAFREAEGTTPSAYRRAALGDGVPSGSEQRSIGF